jgi:Rab GDP dissociation inhibitor
MADNETKDVETKQQDDASDLSEVDVIVLGTGLKECILSGLLSMSGKKVFHIDRNAYYGGESASLNLEQLFEQYKEGAKPPKELGRPFDYTVDLAPKFLMANGDLVKMLIKTKVADYLDFSSVMGSYVLQKGKVHKVPSNAKEAFGSKMLGLLEKNRFRQFLQYVSQYDHKDTKTHKWGYNLETMTSTQLYKKFSLSEGTQQFIGHAIALHLDDTYLDKPALDLVQRSQLYAWSVARYGNSPYIYPKYGLGGLPEGFSRRAAVYGGTFMLNMNKGAFLEGIKYGDDGKVLGINLHEDVVKQYDIPAFIKCKQLVGDPSYFLDTDKVKKTGDIARCIAIMSQPMPNTNNSDSCQVILPAQAIKRKSDIYVCVTSSAQKIAADGKYVAVMSTNMETKDPEADLKQALGLLDKVDERFMWTTGVYEATGDGSADNCFIPSSVDATTHFSTSTKEVQDLYERMTGEKLDLETQPEKSE